MRIRGLLTAGAVAALAAATFAAPGWANAAPGHAAAPAAAQPLTTSDFVSSASGVAVGKVSGVMPARGTARGVSAAPAAAPAATCSEPNCELAYHSGPVQHAPRVFVVFWGSKWNTDATHQSVASYLLNFYKGLGQSNDAWSRIESQYTDKSGGHPAFGRSLLAGSWVDTTHAVPKSVTLDQLGAEAANAVGHFGVTQSQVDNDEFVIASQSGTCFAPAGPGGPVFAGNCGVPPTPTTSGYCAFHSFDPTTIKNVYVPWVNLPFQLDAQTGCGENFINSGSAGMLDGFSITGGHETAETITDPEPATSPLTAAWVDLNDGVSGGEIADKCAWGGALWGSTDPDGNITLPTGTFAMQSLWSNVRHGCVMNGTLPLTVKPVPNQASVTGKAVFVQVHAATTPASPLTYRASGLPGGLRINKFGTIVGTPNVTAGTFRVTVSVSYYAGSASTSFIWKVGSPAGQMRGIASKCVDDANGKTVGGNKIDILTCDGKAQQRITFFASGELVVLGNCITGTSSAFLEPCKAATSQIWMRHADGAYVLKANQKCLTAPSSSNGTRLTLTTCKNNPNQRWSLP